MSAVQLQHVLDAGHNALLQPRQVHAGLLALMHLQDRASVSHRAAAASAQGWSRCLPAAPPTYTPASLLSWICTQQLQGQADLGHQAVLHVGQLQVQRLHDRLLAELKTGAELVH